MAKFYVQLEWTQYMSIDKEIEAESYEEAKTKALAIRIDQVGPEEIVLGDVVDDVMHLVDGERIGCNGMPLVKEAGNG
jgi:hypothetical protein